MSLCNVATNLKHISTRRCVGTYALVIIIIIMWTCMCRRWFENNKITTPWTPLYSIVYND